MTISSGQIQADSFSRVTAGGFPSKPGWEKERLIARKLLAQGAALSFVSK